MRIFLVLTACVWLVQAEDHIELTLGEFTEVQHTECLDYTYFKVKADAAHACEDLTITVNQVEGEPNLYVSKAPNVFPKYKSLTWASYNWGDDEITVGSWDADYGTGDVFYIGVHAYCGDDVNTNYTAAKYVVKAEHTTSTASHPHEEDDIYNKPAVPSTLTAEGYNYHRFCVPDQCVNVTVNISHCMAPSDPGCDGKYGFPELLVSRTVMYMKVNDLTWMLADLDRNVYLSPADPSFLPGHFYIGVYGWCTPDEHCPDPNTCGPCSSADNLPYEVRVTATVLTPEECEDLLEQRPEGPGVGGQDLARASVRVTLVGVLAVAFVLTGSGWF